LLLDPLGSVQIVPNAETTTLDGGQGVLAIAERLEDFTPLNIIRTETVLSRLPIHNLAKNGKVDIRILRRGSGGEVNLKWEVSHSDRYGQARQLAYKLDTLIVNRRIDEGSRPMAPLIRLGSLAQICRELGVPASGKNSNDVRKALHQNAGAYITAKLSYRGADGGERRLEAGFTRYGVVFTGERLPDGRNADAVYIILNDPYREVLNTAPLRPLNYDYLRELRPTAQRFYEILSYRIFAALKNNWPLAKISYGDYCTYSAQQRYYDHEHFRVQMYKVHRPHLDSGYLASAHSEAAVDVEGKPDWIMCYKPGPRARAEFEAFTSRQAAATTALPIDNTPPAMEAAGSELVTELIRRGITLSHARKLVTKLPEDQPVWEQLEWADSLIRSSAPRTFRNPPGLYVAILRDNLNPPATFESRRQRLAREKAEQSRQLCLDEVAHLETAYENYRREEVERQLREEISPETIARLTETKRREYAAQYQGLPAATLEEVARAAARADLARTVPLMSFAEFSKRGN
jgi:hypothetical protein